MEKKEIIQAVANIHNCIAEINVHGDDAIRMAEALQKCRMLVVELQKSDTQNKSEK